MTNDYNNINRELKNSDLVHFVEHRHLKHFPLLDPSPFPFPIDNENDILVVL